MAHIDRQPSDEIFEDIKQAAIKVWKRYDNTYGYVDEKLDRIEPIKNYADNWWTFFGMMDSSNQLRCVSNLKKQATVDFLLEHEEHYPRIVPFNFVIKED